MSTYSDNFPQYIPDGTEETLREYSDSIIRYVGGSRDRYKESILRLQELVDYMNSRLKEPVVVKKEPEEPPMFVVEKSVAIPRITKCVEYKYPFNTMEAGDSFAVPIKETHKTRTALNMFLTGNPSMKFTTRSDKVAGLLRIWRVV
jgi:hypothetical protein